MPDNPKNIWNLYAKIYFLKHKNAVTALILFNRKKMLPLSQDKLTAKKIEIWRKLKKSTFSMHFLIEENLMRLTEKIKL